MKIRVNIGCGRAPTDGWHNLDNSWSVRIAKRTLLAGIAENLKLFSGRERQFISFAKKADVKWADATRHIPERDESVDVVYSSHMLEHLHREDAIRFLKEAHRVLRSGGTIRVAVPNIRYHVDNYLRDGDADLFMEKTLLTGSKPKTLIGRLKYLIVGDRNHQWMYDGESLCRLLSSAGFQEPQVMEPGSTMIADPGKLDLEEGMPESVFAEAMKP